MRVFRTAPRVLPTGDLTRGKGVHPVVQLLRPHQWVKNLLLLLPLLLAHVNLATPQHREKWLHALVAFVTFCLCASAVYVLNDRMDIEADRQHPRKSLRPFPSGRLPVSIAPALIAALFGGSFLLSFLFLPWKFAGMLALYVLLTTAYSLYFKRKLLVDVVVLAALYTHRVLAGGIAADVPVTQWLLAFCMFFFLSLAFAKRYTELVAVQEMAQDAICGRGYRVEDMSVIESVGPTSGYMAVLVLALYINSENVFQLYARPFLLWLVCPILLYWLTRVWFFAKRRALHDDPIVFALTDRVSFIAVALASLLVFLAAWPPHKGI